MISLIQNRFELIDSSDITYSVTTKHDHGLKLYQSIQFYLVMQSFFSWFSWTKKRNAGFFKYERPLILPGIKGLISSKAIGRYQKASNSTEMTLHTYFFHNFAETSNIFFLISRSAVFQNPFTSILPTTLNPFRYSHLHYQLIKSNLRQQIIIFKKRTGLILPLWRSRKYNCL